MWLHQYIWNPLSAYLPWHIHLYVFINVLESAAHTERRDRGDLLIISIDTQAHVSTLALSITSHYPLIIPTTVLITRTRFPWGKNITKHTCRSLYSRGVSTHAKHNGDRTVYIYIHTPGWQTVEVVCINTHTYAYIRIHTHTYAYMHKQHARVSMSLKASTRPPRALSGGSPCDLPASSSPRIRTYVHRSPWCR
jgi:hypothetical protein